MRARGCLGQILFAVLLVLAFSFSSFFWFRVFVRGKSVPAPNLMGRSVAEARAMASDVGLIMQIENTRDRNHDQVPLGAVVWQNRTAGSYVKRGTRIIVGQSLGPLVIRVPDLGGQSPRTALLRLSQRNLRLGNLSYVPVEGSGGIVAAEPPAESIVPAQTPVSLLVGFGSPDPPFVMPDVIDRNIDDVRYAFESKGLTIANIRYEAYPGIPDGVIIRQYPLGGAPVSSRDPITLVVTRQDQPGTFEQTAPAP